MTGRSLGSDHSARSLPPIFDRLVLILTVQSHAFAAFVIVTQRSTYHSLAGVGAIWLLSLSTPLACLVVSRRSGGVLTVWAFVVAGSALLSVDLLLQLLVSRDDIGGPEMWSWGVVGVTVLTLVPFRPVRDILVLAALHGAIALLTIAPAIGRPTVDGFRLLADMNAALLPAVAAAQFVGLYTRAVRAGAVAAAQRAQIQARTRATEAVGRDITERLVRLRRETVPLLRAVSEARIDVVDVGLARQARRLSGELRRELVESGSGSWLFEIPRGDREGASPQARSAQLLDPQRCLPRLFEADRASLAVFVEALHRGRTWDRLSVVLAPEVEPGREVATEDDADLAALTVVALGEASVEAAEDLVVVAAASRFRAQVDTESPLILTADALLPLKPKDPP